MSSKIKNNQIGRERERSMEIDAKRCSMEIDVSKFLDNYRMVRDVLPKKCKMMAVLKGNAYGHGAVRLAASLNEFPEDWLAVATIGEALELRKAGIQKEILILGCTPCEEAPLLAKARLTQTIISGEYARLLACYAEAAGVQVQAHLALDTGMSRIGLVVYGKFREESLEEAEKIYASKQLNVTGIFTHFSSAYGTEPEDKAYTALQYERFIKACESLRERGIAPGIRHCNNSPSIINYPEYALDMSRGGTLLFGALDKKKMKHPVNLHIVAAFKTRVTMIKEIEEGSAISYSRTAVAEHGMRLAVLSAGWYDGYPRQLGNIGKVLIRGKKYPIVGNVCMDLCMADVTASEEIRAGDEAVLLGRQGDEEITYSDLFEPIGLGAGSISSGISERVPRIYVESFDKEGGND